MRDLCFLVLPLCCTVLQYLQAAAVAAVAGSCGLWAHVQCGAQSRNMFQRSSTTRLDARREQNAVVRVVPQHVRGTDQETVVGVRREVGLGEDSIRMPWSGPIGIQLIP